MDSSRALIVFDLDGTFVDSFGDIQAALNHALEHHGLPTHGIEAVRRFVGNGLVRLCERAIDPRLHGRHLEGVVARARAYYAEHPADLAFVFDGMRKAVEELRAAGHPTAIVSNKPDNLVQEIADRLAFRGLFDAITGEAPGAPLKPDPRAVTRFLDELGATGGLVVGDGLPDAEVARAAGMPFVGVAWGTTDVEQLARHGRVAHAPQDVVATVREALKEIGAACNRSAGSDG